MNLLRNQTHSVVSLLKTSVRPLLAAKGYAILCCDNNGGAIHMTYTGSYEKPIIENEKYYDINMKQVLEDYQKRYPDTPFSLYFGYYNDYNFTVFEQLV